MVRVAQYMLSVGGNLRSLGGRSQSLTVTKAN